MSSCLSRGSNCGSRTVRQMHHFFCILFQSFFNIIPYSCTCLEGKWHPVLRLINLLSYSNFYGNKRFRHQETSSPGNVNFGCQYNTNLQLQCQSVYSRSLDEEIAKWYNISRKHFCPIAHPVQIFCPSQVSIPVYWYVHQWPTDQVIICSENSYEVIYAYRHS